MTQVDSTILARLAFAGMLAALLLIFGKPAAPQEQPAGAACLPRTEMLWTLFTLNGETPAARAMLDANMAEWTVNAATGAWSMIISSRQPDAGDLKSCLVMGGHRWKSIEPNT